MAWVQKVTLLFIAFIVGSDELLLGSILTPIGNDFPVRPESMTLFVSAYSRANAACALCFSVLSDRYGRMRILIPASILFAATSIGTSLDATFEIAPFFRLLTGAASAGMLSLVFTTARDAGARTLCIV